jgi:hypothetical protein
LPSSSPIARPGGAARVEPEARADAAVGIVEGEERRVVVAEPETRADVALVVYELKALALTTVSLHALTPA